MILKIIELHSDFIEADLAHKYISRYSTYIREYLYG